jgi:hypothetical protein
MYERLKDERPAGDPAKLVVGLLGQEQNLLAQAQAALSEKFGAVTLVSRDVPFDFTDYYEKEMGPGLVRRWVAFLGLVEPDQLYDFKLKTGLLEKRFPGPNRGRRVNLDPGLLSLHNLVLASTKDFAHRIYLRDGIYAEVSLLHHAGRYEPLPWTYPDYRTDACQEFLAACRKELFADITRARTTGRP